MKKVLLSVAVVAFAMSFTSCKKCVECTHPTLGTQENCEGNKTSRDLWQSGMEFSGYTCS
jgi:hypothetical protein